MGDLNMASLDMEGPYDFTEEKIDEIVTEKSAGNYALGRMKKDKKTKKETKTFLVSYVGRSDDDVNNRLKEHLEEKYKKFKYSYATSPKEAFKKECKNYHDFNPPDNKKHPDRPDNTDWKCPYCDVFKEDEDK